MLNQDYKLLTVKELSEALKISKSNVYKLINEQKIPYVKINRKYLFQENKISEWVNMNSYNPTNA